MTSGLRQPFKDLRLSRRRLLALGGLTTATAALGIGNAPTAAASTAQLLLDFETGSVGAPVTRCAGAAVSAAYARSGRYGCRLDPALTTSHVAYLNVDRKGFALGKPYATFSMCFRLVTAPKAGDTYMNLFEIGSTSTAKQKSQFTVFFRNNRLTCDFGWRETLDLGPVPSVGQWHLIQAIVHFGASAYTARVSVDGAAASTLTSANNKTPQSVRALWLHYPGKAVDYAMDVDDIQMATSDTVPTFLAAPTR